MMNLKVLDCARKSVLCWLATVDEDGCPNVSPKEIFCTTDERTLLVANIASPGTLKNIQARPNVCVSFVDVFVQKGFKLKGVASVVRAGERNFEAYSHPLRALAGERFAFSSLFAIEVQSVEPILAPSYRFFPDTEESAQIDSAMHTYGVQPRHAPR